MLSEKKNRQKKKFFLSSSPISLSHYSFLVVVCRVKGGMRCGSVNIMKNKFHIDEIAEQKGSYDGRERREKTSPMVDPVKSLHTSYIVRENVT